MIGFCVFCLSLRLQDTTDTTVFTVILQLLEPIGVVLTMFMFPHTRQQYVFYHGACLTTTYFSSTTE
jgi:hypothetical protein